MKRPTRERVRKVEADHIAAITVSRITPPVHDVVCFHCQQSAEKYLKALLQELGLPIIRTHDLEALLLDLLTHHRSLRSLRRGLAFLTGYAVDTRYPGRNATKRQMDAALRWAERVRSACCALLGIRMSRRKSP